MEQTQSILVFFPLPYMQISNGPESIVKVEHLPMRVLL